MQRTPSSSRLTAIDWRTLSADRVDPLYAAEIERWSSVLEWDTTKDWYEVEKGRQFGTVSGVAITDESGAIVGWSYYIVHKRALQVGAFTAASDSIAQLMLDTILSDEIRSSVDSVTFFAFADEPNLAAALRVRGLAVDRYWYLGRELLRQPAPRVPEMRRWRVDDLQATAELLGRAYDGRDEARPFAPQGTAEQWSEYIGQLTKGTGCGSLMTDVGVCIAGGPNRLLGVALVTRISDGTAHLAQLAIDPQMQGKHFGKQLLETVCAAANQAGFRRMTLFVGGRNSRARSLYESSRFETLTSFLAAGTLHPRRSTSVAPGNVVITRR